MEFTLFLNFATPVLAVFFILFYQMVKYAMRFPAVLYSLLGLSLVLTVFSPFLGAALLISLIGVLLYQKFVYFQKGRALKFGILFAGVMLLLLAWYLPWGKSPEFWDGFLGRLYATGWMKGIFIELVAVVRFFGYYYPVYPAVIAATLHLAFRYGIRDQKQHQSFWYRFTKVYDHRQIFFTIGGFVLLTLVYLLCAGSLREVLSSEGCLLLKDVVLNVAVFFALPYIFFGVMSIIYGLRRLKLPYFLCWVILYFFIIFSGPVFIFTLILIMGLGMTDIWMNYHKRQIRLFKK